MGKQKQRILIARAIYKTQTSYSWMNQATNVHSWHSENRFPKFGNHHTEGKPLLYGAPFQNGSAGKNTRSANIVVMEGKIVEQELIVTINLKI